MSASTANHPVAPAMAAPRPATTSAEGPSTNGHVAHNHPAPPPPGAIAVAAAGIASSKKGKPKKAPESQEASKLIAQRISQLELDAAGDKEQEAEIGGLLPYFFVF